ncbi:MAG TPA: universal stress protein [Gemmatimonadales bacterium]|nr:universal stress protein [Gemmatimonadales bacterium]
MFARLVVGLDGSAGSDAALETALSVARRFKTTIVLAVVTDIRLLEAPLFETAGSVWAEGMPAGPAAAELREALEERATRILEVAVAKVTEAGLPVETARATGMVEEELGRLAGDAEAIAVGRRGELHEGIGTLGRVTCHLIKRSPKPVLVAGDTPSRCERPLVAYDGGETSSHALELAARYAEALALPLAVVHVTDDAAAGDELLAQAAVYLSGRGAAFQTHRLAGEVVRAVTEFVSAYGADLLVAGAHGGRRRWALGSHAERLLKATTIPVIIQR